MEERRRNLLPLMGFLVCVVAFLSYFLFFYQFPATRDLPWTGWILSALGLGLVGMGLARAFRQPERYRGKILGSVLAVAEPGGLRVLPPLDHRRVAQAARLRGRTGGWREGP